MANKKRKKCLVNCVAPTAAAIVVALSMLVLGIFGNLGIYTGAVQAMQQWHLFFDLSVVGIIAGMLEAAIWTFVTVGVFMWIYAKLDRR